MADFVVDYMYNEAGIPIAFAICKNGGAYEYYAYETNIQGDIVAVWDMNADDVVYFYYDAWGNFTTGGSKSTDADFMQAVLFRYRGYIYDQETGLYYLQTRYYDPEIGRFINADDIGYLGANGDLQAFNLYAYCSNNPVMHIDPTGEIIVELLLGTAAATLLLLVCAASGLTLLPLPGQTITPDSTEIRPSILSDIEALLTNDSNGLRNHTVYALIDDNLEVQYIGRTIDVNRRAEQHKANPFRKNLTLVVLQDNLTYKEARALEQACMVYHHTLNTTNKMNNQINGVTPKKWGVFTEIARGTLNYAWNKVTNEILYWIGS